MITNYSAIGSPSISEPYGEPYREPYNHIIFPNSPCFINQIIDMKLGRHINNSQRRSIILLHNMEYRYRAYLHVHVETLV